MNTSTRPTNTKSLWTLVIVVVLAMEGTSAFNQWREARTADRIKASLGQARVTLYTTQTCVYCVQARSWLRTHGIAWEECDVEQDASCKATFDAHGAPGTPVVRIGSRWHLGFDPNWVAEALMVPMPGNAENQAASSPKADTSPRP